MRCLFSWYTTYIYCLIIIGGSLLPIEISPKPEFPLQDKIIHSLTYLLLAFLVVNTFSAKQVDQPRLRSLLFAFLLGLFIEIGQYFIPYRSFEAGDILANLFGSILGSLLII
ncbi:MAG: VanZ family protein [Candidatus Omnitrophota bacterium]